MRLLSEKNPASVNPFSSGRRYPCRKYRNDQDLGTSQARKFLSALYASGVLAGGNCIELPFPPPLSNIFAADSMCELLPRITLAKSETTSFIIWA